MPKYTQEEPRLIKYFSQIVQQLFPIVQIYVKSMSRMKGTSKKDFSDSEVYMTWLKIVLCPPCPPPSQKKEKSFTIKHQMCQKFVRNAFLAPKYARNVEKIEILLFC